MVRSRARLPLGLPRKRDLRGDLSAGLTIGLVQIPDAMASAILALVKPVNGLNTLVIGTPIGALFAGSVFMTVTTTGAIALAVSDALGKTDSSQRMGLLIVLTLLVGVIQLVLGLLKLGWITKFVSNAVMVGFITGVCILIILSQLGDLTSYDSSYSNKVAKTIDLLLHLGQIDWPTLVVGLATIALILVLDRTAVAKFSMVLAFAGATAVTAVAGLSSVARVGDIASIPSSLPQFAMPDLSHVPQLLVPAVAIAVIGLVQGAGVGKSVPNPDGTYGDTSRDFVAQGAANAVMGFFRGMPIGGSVSASALNVSSGARSRWANVYAGVIVAVVLLLFGSYVEKVPLPTVAALLIVAAVAALKPSAVMEVWRTNWAARIIMLVTLALTLAVPLQYAVLAGVVLSTIQYVSSSSLDLKVRRLVPAGEGASQKRNRRSGCRTTRSPSSTSTAACSTRLPRRSTRSCRRWPARTEPCCCCACAGGASWAAVSSPYCAAGRGNSRKATGRCCSRAWAGRWAISSSAPALPSCSDQRTSSRRTASCTSPAKRHSRRGAPCSRAPKHRGLMRPPARGSGTTYRIAGRLPRGDALPPTTEVAA